ncbi:hypothetical protein Tco_0887008 [Tanacetum coccineum]
MVFNSPCLTDKKELIHHEGTALVVINSPCYHNKELASPEQTATAEVVPKSVAGSSFPAASSTYVVPTGRVVVPTGRYIVPAGKVIIIVSTGRLSLVPTGRVLSPVKIYLEWDPTVAFSMLVVPGVNGGDRLCEMGVMYREREVIEGVQREQGHRIVGVESAVTALTERIAELERDNRRLRGTASVESQRVDRLQRGMSRMQRELRQIRRL